MKTLFITSIIIMMSHSCFASINIDSISGNTINGSSFSTKDVSDIFFDNFDDGVNGNSLQSVSSDWAEFNSHGGALYNNEQSYSGGLSSYNFVSSTGGGRSDFATSYYRTDQADEVFISYKLRYEGTGSKYGLGKQCRITSSTDAGGGGVYNETGVHTWSNINFYYGGSGYVLYDNSEGQINLGYMDVDENEWSTCNAYVKLSTNDIDDGIVFWENLGISTVLSENSSNRISADTYQFDSVLLGLMYANIGTIGGDATMKMWIDDIYISWGSNARSHVTVANSSSYTERTIEEIQIPTAWTDTSISVTWNQGSFANNETAYLFVVDSDGTASAGLEGTFVDGVFYETIPSVTVSGNINMTGNIKISSN